MRSPLLALFALVPSALHAQTISGPADGIDGDSLTVNGVEVRLYGIDAPEGPQSCIRDNAAWPCGEASARQLRSMIENKTVVCAPRGTDAYGRTLSICAAGGIELNQAMVAHGWATAFREYSAEYIRHEAAAKNSRLGIWDSTFVMPADFRRQAQDQIEVARESVKPAWKAAAPPAIMGRCAIKGNRNRKGQWIYHVPGMPYYDATRAEEIFCTESQARAAGYRRAMVR